MSNQRGTFAALLILLSLTVPTVHAAGPAIFMVYSTQFERPLFIVAKDLRTYAFMFCARGYDVRAAAMPDGPFVNVAIFWNANVWANPSLADRLMPSLRPEMAGQHGRIYLPRDGRPATIFVTRNTHIVSTRVDTGEPMEWGQPSPVPVTNEAFEGGCTVSQQSASTAKAAGIVGF